MQKLNTIGFALLGCLSFNLAVAGLDDVYQQQTAQEQAAQRAAKKRQADEVRIRQRDEARTVQSELERKHPTRVVHQPSEPEMVAIPNTNYEIGKYEITQGLWKTVMGSNPSRFKYCGDTCPVETVSWDDIQIFIKKLNANTGKNYRLPSEAEWEAACLAGNHTLYCGGDNLNSVAWNGENSSNKTHPVGQKNMNNYGLYDMSGNVSEWVQDKKDNMFFDVRVIRGGSCANHGDITRAVYNDYSLQTTWRSELIGFRLARTIP